MMTDQEKTQRIQDCESFEELFAAFDEIGEIQGSRKPYSPERLKEKVVQIRLLMEGLTFDRIPFNLITRTHGIRAKTMELFWYEINEI